MAQELTIIKQDNMRTIVSAAPQSYESNKISKDRCIAAGQSILEAITAGGMTDELDQQAAVYIEKSRKTVKKMLELRSPVTKLFDDIRKEFTAMENAIDPTKADTIANKLQQFRNAYAAKKRAEEEERRRQELARQQLETARQNLARDIEEDYRRKLQDAINAANNSLEEMDSRVTLDNYEDMHRLFNDFSCVLPSDFVSSLKTTIRIPAGISVAEVQQAETQLKEKLGAKFAEQYNFEVDGTRLYFLDRLPSKKAELERIAAASAAEKARLEAEMAERKRKEDAEREAERQRKEQEERQKAEEERKMAEMNDLFNQQATIQGYQPKAKVTKKINLLNPEGIMPVLSMWWTKEGSTLTVEELSKMFKKQITFCEKLANKEEVFIKDESVEYIDEVKAK